MGSRKDIDMDKPASTFESRARAAGAFTDSYVTMCDNPERWGIRKMLEELKASKEEFSEEEYWRWRFSFGLKLGDYQTDSLGIITSCMEQDTAQLPLDLDAARSS